MLFYKHFIFEYIERLLYCSTCSSPIAPRAIIYLLRYLLSQVKLGQRHVHISHLVEKKLGVLRMVLCGERVSMASLVVLVDRVKEVLVQDRIVRGELVSL